MNGYAGCSTGQQWDAMTYRVFDRKLPMFNVSMPMLWGNKPDAGYMRGGGVGARSASTSTASCAS